jgi:tetratricopeptide (TPR) repeat protein
MKLPRPWVLQAFLSVLVFSPSGTHAQDTRCRRLGVAPVRYAALAEEAASADPPDPCLAEYLRGVNMSKREPNGALIGSEHSVELLRSALAKAEAAWGADSVKLVPFLEGLAWQVWQSAPGGYDTAPSKYWDEPEALDRRAIAITEKAYGPEDPHVVEFLSELARVVVSKEDFSQGERIHLRMLAIDEKADGPEGTSLLYPLEQLANDYIGEARIAMNTAVGTCKLGDDCTTIYEAIQNRRNEQTEPVLARAVEIQKKSPGPNGQFLLQPMTKLAEFYRTEGKTAEPEDLYRQIADIQTKVYGPSSSQVVGTWLTLGQLYQRQGDYAQAEAYFQLVLGATKQQRPANQGSSNTAAALMDLGRLSADQKKTEEAKAYYQQAVAAVTSRYSPDDPNQNSALFNLVTPLEYIAGLYAQIGLYDDAQALYLRVMSIEENNPLLVPNYVMTLQHYANFLWNTLKRLDDAQAVYLKAITVCQRNPKLNHPIYVDTLQSYANLLRQMNRPQDAEKVDEQVEALKGKTASKVDMPAQ